jgi:hypothetical protein
VLGDDIATAPTVSAPAPVTRRAPATSKPADQKKPVEKPTSTQAVFSGFGIASAALGVVAVIAIVLGGLFWSGHRAEIAERTYQTDVLQAAADWTSVLINMNKDTVDQSLQKLHDGAVGQLNADFESTTEPFKAVVLKLQSQTTGQVESVAIESLHHAPANANGSPQPQPELATVATRTDTVIVVATSVSQNAGGAKPQTVRWNLRLDVSDVDGKQLISRLEILR